MFCMRANNITDEQKTVLIGEAYKAQKMTQGGNRGNQHTKVASYHCDNLAKGKTADKIAADFKVGYASVIRSEQFVDGLNEADKVSPGFKAAVISGNLKAPKNVISSIRHMIRRLFMAGVTRKESIIYRYETPAEKSLAEQMAAQDISKGFEYEKPRRDRSTGNAITLIRKTRHFS